MQIILKSRFQFPHWVMKNVLFPKVITIFKLIYLFWFKIEQTLPGFGVTRFTSACFLSPFPGSCATWLRRCLNSKTLSTAHNGKTNSGRPGWTPNLKKEKNKEQIWPGAVRPKIIIIRAVIHSWNFADFDLYIGGETGKLRNLGFRQCKTIIMPLIAISYSSCRRCLRCAKRCSFCSAVSC